MLQDTDLFTQLEKWLTIGDVLPTVKWEEAPSPDERYTVGVTWKFRSERVGEATFIIEPVFGTDDFRLFWLHLAFKDDWQNKGLYSTIVEQMSKPLLRYGIIETVANPTDKEAERRLASQGFAWVGNAFTLDHRS